NSKIQNTIYSIIEDEKGNIWFGTEYAGVIKYDGKKIRRFPIEENESISVKTLGMDKNGTIWLGTNEGGLYRLENENFEKLDSVKNLTNTIVEDIHLDAAGNLWFGTDGKGAVMYD